MILCFIGILVKGTGDNHLLNKEKIKIHLHIAKDFGKVNIDLVV
jgi:hypothetical protein